MKMVKQHITREELKKMAQNSFGDLVKAVVDVEKQVMVVDASLHADEEAFLLHEGSKQESLWGINLYPDLTGDDFIEFDSMINLRPNQGNMTRGVDKPEIQEKIKNIVYELIT